MTALSLTSEQIRAFRAARSFLIDPAPDLVHCARVLMGAQAQVHTCALHALALRTANFPSAADVEEAILTSRTLVRTWGQRDTLHLYDVQDLPMIVGSRRIWKNTGRKGGMPSDELVEQMAQWALETGEPITRAQLLEVLPQDYIDSLRDHKAAGTTPEKLAASRIIWSLAMAGHIVFGAKQGREQGYVHRQLWLPELDWSVDDALTSAAEATRRYLSVFGPSTIQDIAHHVGSRISDCKQWMSLLADELIEITCTDRPEKTGLLAMAKDADDLQVTPVEYAPRLLPAYDTMLMSHKDKRWILPDADEEPLIWKKAAVVRAVVIHQGQIVATWQQHKTTKKLTVTIEPLGAWRGEFLDAVALDAQRYAAHLGLTLKDCALA